LDLAKTTTYRIGRQYAISILLILFVAVLCFLTQDLIGYKSVALILLVAVSINAILFDIAPVVLSAFLSAVVWNFFFIPPVLTFHIGSTEDGLLFFMYFVIASIHAVLTYKIRQVEKKERDEEEKIKTIKLYNTLLNSLSHELRTPVSTILGAVDTLKESRDRLSDANQAELLSQIDIASIRLNRQVENLLNMSRLESSMLKLNLNWCDLNDLVNSTVHKLEAYSTHHHIVFGANDRLPLFKIDAGLIEQVVHNILYNALLYTPPSTTVTVTLGYEHEACVIRIADNGPGIAHADQQFVFDKFFRVAHTRSGGSGLGLSIAKGFVEAHNGSIQLLNGAEPGAHFVVTLPVETSFVANLKNE
jgi:two-component system sensor histidine kinase KdpD